MNMLEVAGDSEDRIVVLHAAVLKAFALVGEHPCGFTDGERVCLDCVNRAIDLAARRHYERERAIAVWIDLGGEAGGA